MKAICSYSGLEFQIQYFPHFLDTGSIAHPVFSIPLPKLWKYLPKWKAGELTEVDSYLLFLAILKQTEQVEWRLPCKRTTRTTSLVAQNMERLFSVVGKVVSVRHPRFCLPRFVITSETNTLDTIRYWLDAWELQYQNFCNGLRDEDARDKLKKKEAALERLIKNPSIKAERYAHILAAWAVEAGEFPQNLTAVDGVEISLSQYWESIIIKCHDNVEMITIPEADLVELLEHCEEYIDAGSIFAFHLFNTLREGLSTIRGFFSIGSTTYQLVDTAEPDAIETANIATLVATAPTEAPKRTDYPSDFAFLRAKMRFALASASNQANQAKEGI